MKTENTSLEAVVVRQLMEFRKQLAILTAEVTGGFYTINEFQAKTGLSTKNIHQLCRDGLLKATQLDKGHKWLIDKSEFTRLMNEAKENFKPN